MPFENFQTFTLPAQSIGLACLVAEIVGSNPAYGMDVCLCLSVLCCPVEALGRANPSSKEAYQVSKLFIISLNWKRSQSLIRIVDGRGQFSVEVNFSTQWKE
jgi:hypothetical protein